MEEVKAAAMPVCGKLVACYVVASVLCVHTNPVHMDVLFES